MDAAKRRSVAWFIAFESGRCSRPRTVSLGNGFGADRFTDQERSASVSKASRIPYPVQYLLLRMEGEDVKMAFMT